jgi:cysteinyl-tRNA synthetase
MPLKLYNSLTRTEEEFVPRDGKKVQMFVCGPTVYDRIHIGNARTFTIFDVIAKWLVHSGYDVTYIQNITDIDDKIILRAGQKNEDPLKYAHEFDDAFRADMKALGNTAVTQYARATDHIPEIIRQVQTLLDKDYAYELGDGIYYDLSKFKDYGKLSGRTTIQSEDAISRIDENREKRNSGDFALWKKSKAGEPSWESPWGQGRPGWHIEDTAITEHFFGPQYDVHGGARDLIFPHHEAEIAQQEAASGKVPFVKYWMHAGFLENKSAKMSKSLGNFLTLHEALEQYEPAVLRFYLLSNHYRAPLELNDDSLKSAQAAVQRIGELARKKTDATISAKSAIEAITDAMDDDFNTAKAFAAIFSFIKEANAKTAVPEKEFFNFISDIFGIVPDVESDIPVDIQALVDKRQSARESKDWTSSDAIRDELATLGWTVDDTTYGPLVKRK